MCLKTDTIKVHSSSISIFHNSMPFYGGNPSTNVQSNSFNGNDLMVLLVTFNQ